MNINEKTRIIDLEVGDLIDLITNIVNGKMQPPPPDNNDDFIYGYKGLAEYLKCSLTCVYKRIKSKKYDKAIMRNGKKIIFLKSEIIKIISKK